MVLQKKLLFSLGLLSVCLLQAPIGENRILKRSRPPFQTMEPVQDLEDCQALSKLTQTEAPSSCCASPCCTSRCCKIGCGCCVFYCLYYALCGLPEDPALSIKNPKP